MLGTAGLPKRPGYGRADVCQILCISADTFWLLVKRYERCPITGGLVRPDALDSFSLHFHGRVTFEELSKSLCRDDTSERQVAD